jgi:DNA primase catalytic subunit
MKSGERIQKVPAEFPLCMRFASLEERGAFYRKEFDLKKVGGWMGMHPSPAFAVIIGRYSRIFPREYARISSYTVVIDDYDGLEDLRRYIVQYRPESAYYDRNLYRDRRVCAACMKDDDECWRCDGFLGQELAFDMDVENLDCPLHGNLEKRMARGDHLSFCEYDLSVLRGVALDLFDELRGSFKKIKITYSGRGYHLHVLDRSAYSMPRKERGELADQIGVRFPIDEWVTEGESHLIRLPFSLNGLVSRIVQPLEKKELDQFDPVMDKRCVPKFIKTP